tara:strand:+ start:834 stop:1700 length:867 start_codon:yes stop_codon:yes gene_type:complete
MRLEFPHPKYDNESYIFENEEFVNMKNKKERYKILEFSQNYEGWTEDHTEMIDHQIGNRHPIDLASQKMCIYMLNKYNKKNEKIILEIGCSSGNLIKRIKEFKNFFYIGSDVIKKPIKRLSEEYKGTPFIIFDITKNPFRKSFCDSLIMLNVLEHIKDDEKALIEAHKLLNTDGVLILEVPSGNFLYDEYDKELLHFRRYNMKDLVKKIENAGFRIEKKTHLGFLLFPFFVFIKILNKFFKKKGSVSKQANFSNNFIVKILLDIETKLNKLNLPFGIRCFVSARKVLK